ncbi:MAG: Rpn family recombination-promoting nuclease/putative transposase [Magnetococcales bacterium]|nr:Rpn family recombination-promoting nuclease/putative transposase [Magnetococcales bacterium]
MADYDSSYRLLFSHADMVRDLLQGFVHEAWVAQLDFTTLEKVSGSYVTDDLRDRTDDVIWRARWGEGWLYVYLLLEFQSTVDPFMALRVAAYVMLLYQDLVKSGQVERGGLLPPVLPLVLYNGKPAWNAPLDVADLVLPVPGGLDRYRPHQRYLLIDEVRYNESDLVAMRNLSAALFRLEKSRTPAEIRSVVGALRAWLQDPGQLSLRRAFTVMLGRVLLPRRFPGQVIPEAHDLQEVDAMLAETVQEWTREWEARGQRKGEAHILLRLIRRRFGPTPAWAEEKVMAADLPTLERWAEAVLDAGSLEEVFR